MPAASSSATRSAWLIVTSVRSASCLRFSAAVSGVANFASGMVMGSSLPATSGMASGMKTCAWQSMVTLFGRISRPGRPCTRAAVAP